MEWAERMNAWGPAGCRKARVEIIQHMQKSAKNYGWLEIGAAVARAIGNGLAVRLSITDPYGSLLDEAIRLAETALPRDHIDILLPLGPGSHHNDIELRYALRSIERYAVNLRRVVVIGAIPAWLRETDRVLPVPLREFRCNKAARIARKVSYAFERLDVTDTIAFWNDDYVLLRDRDLTTIPDHYRGLLWRQGNDGWSTLLNHTARTLHAAGLPQRHYDIHVPILYERDKWLAINDWWKRCRNDSRGLVAKSIYGNNHCTATAVSTSDCKLKATWRARVDSVAAHRWVLSYGDVALRTGLTRWLAKRFPDPSACESQPPAKAA